MHNHVDFVVVNSFLFQCLLQTVGGDVDVPQKIFHWLRIAVAVVFIHLAVVVEKDAENATLNLYRVGQARIQTSQHVQHLMSVVEQAALEGMVDVCGGWFHRIWLIERICILLYQGSEPLVMAVAHQLGNCGIPFLPLHRTWQQVVERMPLLRKSTHVHVELASRLVSTVVLDKAETDQLTKTGLIGGSHVPHRQRQLFVKILQLQFAEGGAGARGGVRTANHKVFFDVG